MTSDADIRRQTQDALVRARAALRAERMAKSSGNGRAQAADTPTHVSLDDFYAYMPMHMYIFVPSGELWPASSVKARVPPITDGTGKIFASSWLDRHKPIEQMTWAPGQPMIIRDRLLLDGGLIEKVGVSCFNLYKPPIIKTGDPARVGPWLDHARKVYGSDADHIVQWFAHRVQRPHIKINHGLILGGHQGIGKDTLLEPVKHAVGPWNFVEVTPRHLLGYSGVSTASPNPSSYGSMKLAISATSIGTSSTTT
jgi:hypothetical protein